MSCNFTPRFQVLWAKGPKEAHTKLQQLTGYPPTYPKKVLRGAALTAAALVAIGGVTGCRVPIPQNPQIEGMVAMPEPTDQELVLDGEVAIVEPEPTPEGPLQTTGMLLAPTATPEA